jgi:ribosomal protein S18 acetylase RimI-like enzyme
MGRNNADFHSVEISIKGHEDLDSALEHGGPWTVEAHKNGERVGYLEGKGEVKDVYVHPDHRRQGIATALYRKARQLGMEHGTIRTDAGEAWAKTTPDYFPRMLKVEDRD